MGNSQDGLYDKYDVKRNDGDPEGKHVDCRHFVLDPNHDPMSRRALQTYMQEATKNGYIALAADLQKWLKDLGVED